MRLVTEEFEGLAGPGPTYWIEAPVRYKNTRGACVRSSGHTDFSSPKIWHRFLKKVVGILQHKYSK